MLDGAKTIAHARFRAALEKLEPTDAARPRALGRAAPVEVSLPRTLEEHTTVQQFVPLAARFTALRDFENRLATNRQRPSPSEPTSEAADD